MNRIMLFLCTAISFSIANGQVKTDYKTAPNGIRYKMIVANPNGKTVQPMDIVTVAASVYVNDSLLQENKTPVPMQVMEPQQQGDFFDALLMMHESETISFAFDPVIFIGEMLPPFIKKEDVMYVTIALVKTQSMQEFEQEQMYASEKKIQEEKMLLRNYMKEHQLQGQEMENGMFIVVLKEGEGALPEKGNTVNVHYSGKLFNGT
jgi:hypothetical protein